MSRDNSISREPQKIESGAYCSAPISESFDKFFITRSTTLESRACGLRNVDRVISIRTHSTIHYTQLLCITLKSKLIKSHHQYNNITQHNAAQLHAPYTHLSRPALFTCIGIISTYVLFPHQRYFLPLQIVSKHGPRLHHFCITDHVSDQDIIPRTLATLHNSHYHNLTLTLLFKYTTCT